MKCVSCLLPRIVKRVCFSLLVFFLILFTTIIQLFLTYPTFEKKKKTVRKNNRKYIDI